MVSRYFLVSLFSVFFVVGTAKPIGFSFDSVSRNSCPTWCFLGKGEYTKKVLETKCPSDLRVACKRTPKDSDELKDGTACYCGPTTLPPTTTYTTTTIANTVPTVPPNVPGNSPIGTPTPDGPVSCGVTIISGYSLKSKFEVDIGKKSGEATNFELFYEMYEIPDQVVLTYEGKEIFDSGYVSDTKTIKLEVKGTSSVVTVDVHSPNPLSAWDLILQCA